MDNIIKPLEKCTVGIGKLIKECMLQCIGKQLNCIKDDHQVHLGADQLSVHTGQRNLHLKSSVRLK